MNPLGTLPLFQELEKRIGFEIVCEFEMCETGNTDYAYDRRCNLFLCAVHRESHECKVVEFTATKKSAEALAAENRKRQITNYFDREIVPGLKARGYQHCAGCDRWINPQNQHVCNVLDRAK